MEGDLRLVRGFFEEDHAIHRGYTNVELDDRTTATLTHSPTNEQGVIDNTHVEISRRFRVAGSLESDKGSRARVGLLNAVAVSETPSKGVTLAGGQAGDLQGKGKLYMIEWKWDEMG